VWQPALTLEAKISNFDIIRQRLSEADDHTPADYTDYSFRTTSRPPTSPISQRRRPLIDPRSISRPRPLPQVQQRAAHHHAQGQSAAFVVACHRAAAALHPAELPGDQLPTDKSSRLAADLVAHGSDSRRPRLPVFGELSYDLTPKLTARSATALPLRQLPGRLLRLRLQQRLRFHSGELRPPSSPMAPNAMYRLPEARHPRRPCVDLANEVKKNARRPSST